MVVGIGIKAFDFDETESDSTSRRYHLACDNQQSLRYLTISNVGLTLPKNKSTLRNFWVAKLFAAVPWK